MKRHRRLQPPVQDTDRHLHRHRELRPIINRIRVLDRPVTAEGAPVILRRKKLGEPVMKRELAPKLPHLVCRTPRLVRKNFRRLQPDVKHVDARDHQQGDQQTCAGSHAAVVTTNAVLRKPSFHGLMPPLCHSSHLVFPKPSVRVSPLPVTLNPLPSKPAASPSSSPART